MKYQIVPLTLCLLLAGCEQNESEFKADVIKGYKQRCMEVLTSKGYSNTEIARECNCEADIIANNFSTFELIISSAKSSVDQAPISEQKTEELKQKLQSCKVKRSKTLDEGQ